MKHTFKAFKRYNNFFCLMSRKFDLRLMWRRLWSGLSSIYFVFHFYILCIIFISVSMFITWLTLKFELSVRSCRRAPSVVWFARFGRCFFRSSWYSGHSINICWTEMVTRHLWHFGASLFSIRWPWVSLVCPMRKRASTTSLCLDLWKEDVQYLNLGLMILSFTGPSRSHSSCHKSLWYFLAERT